MVPLVISRWWVWDYPTVWVPITCGILGIARVLIIVSADRRRGFAADLDEIGEIHDGLNHIAHAETTHRACVLLAHNGVLLSKFSKPKITMLFEVTNKRPSRKDWQSQLATPAYLSSLAELCRGGYMRFRREDMPEDSLLRAQWEIEKTAGADVYLLRIQRWSIWWALIGRVGIRAIYYLSVNVSAFERSPEDVITIDHGTKKIKRIYGG